MVIGICGYYRSHDTSNGLFFGKYLLEEILSEKPFVRKIN